MRRLYGKTGIKNLHHFNITAVLIFFGFVVPSVAQTSDRLADGTLLGDAISGIHVYQNANGEIIFKTDKVVRLNTGRELRKEDDRWVVVPMTAPPVVDVAPMEMTLYIDKYNGRRIRLQGVRFFGVSRDWGLLNLPGGAVKVMFKNANREDLRYLIENCSELGDRANCYESSTVR